MFSLLLAACIATVGHGQNGYAAKIVDEFPPSLCSDDLRARFDLFFALLAASPGAKGHFSISSGYDLPGRAMKIRRIFINHIAFRGEDPDRFRISIERGGLPSVSLWLVPRGVEIGGMGTPAPTNVTYHPKTLFDSSGIFKVTASEVEFGEGSSEPCDFGLDLGQFAESLKFDDEGVAYLLATSDRRISRAKALTALKLTVEELSKHHGLAPERIKTKYVGSRKESEMQLWIVSKNSAAPDFREGALP